LTLKTSPLVTPGIASATEAAVGNGHAGIEVEAGIVIAIRTGAETVIGAAVEIEIGVGDVIVAGREVVTGVEVVAETGIGVAAGSGVAVVAMTEVMVVITIIAVAVTKIVGGVAIAVGAETVTDEMKEGAKVDGTRWTHLGAKVPGNPALYRGRLTAIDSSCLQGCLLVVFRVCLTLDVWVVRNKLQ